MNKKVVIIGAGLSGMTTGIYLQMNGYDTEILEKNSCVGGACVGWHRSGCYIDGCIHWMTGVRPGSSYYDIWRETRAIADDTEIYFQDDFSTFAFSDGTRVTLWADVDRLREELLAFAPEDKGEIIKLCRLIKRFGKIEGPVSRPVDMMSLFELIKIGVTMAGDYYYVARTSKISCEDYARRFKNPKLAELISNYMAPGYNLMSMLYMLGHVCAKNGGIPIGGSLALSKRLEARYKELGGKIRFSSEVEKINVEGGRASSALLKSGEAVPCDWLVSTVPAEHCLKKLLCGKYKLPAIDKRLLDVKKYPTYTYTTAVIKCTADTAHLPLSLHVFDHEPIEFDGAYTDVAIRNYAYDETMRGEGGAVVIQAAVIGDDGMYSYWRARKDDGTYRDRKREVGEALLRVVLSYYPELQGKLEIIDVITPCTYERYLNSRHGSFQGFVHTAEGAALMDRGIVKGLDNFLLSGQCIFQSGGMPPAVITGRFAAQRICKRDKKKFVGKSEG